MTIKKSLIVLIFLIVLVGCTKIEYIDSHTYIPSQEVNLNTIFGMLENIKTHQFYDYYSIAQVSEKYLDRYVVNLVFSTNITLGADTFRFEGRSEEIISDLQKFYYVLYGENK